MSATASALFAGTVIHKRLRPRAHRLRYAVFSLLLDLDEIDQLAGRLRLFSRNRPNLFSFYDRDYCGGTEQSLRHQVEAHMRAAGVEPDGGPIRLLTMPRVVGYAFNPLSVYFCYCRSGRLTAILYEVNNTFGQRHSYLIPVTEHDGGSRPIRQECEKRFYVSPFLEMEIRYAFCVVPPGERVAVSITGRDADGPILVALLTADRASLTDRNLARVFLTYPLLTLKVIAGIHWEALLLWLKGVRLQPRPAPPSRPVTLAD